MKKTTSSIFIAILFLVCIQGNVIAVNNIYNDSNTIYYNGDINRLGFERFKLLFHKNQTVTRVKFNSLGGETINAINFANWILDNNLDIEIDKYCISSCANYIFLSGKNKYLNKSSFLGWHGGTLQFKNDRLTTREIYQLSNFSVSCDRNKIPLATLALPTYKAVLECQFFSRVNANLLMTMYGQVKGSNYYSDKVPLWGYSAPALAYLGVDNIILINGLWEQRPMINDKLMTYFELNEVSAQIIAAKFIAKAFH